MKVTRWRNALFGLRRLWLLAMRICRIMVAWVAHACAHAYTSFVRPSLCEATWAHHFCIWRQIVLIRWRLVWPPKWQVVGIFVWQLALRVYTTCIHSMACRALAFQNVIHLRLHVLCVRFICLGQALFKNAILDPDAPAGAYFECWRKVAKVWSVWW